MSAPPARTPLPHRRAVRLVPVVVALAVLAAACSKDSPDDNAADRTTTTVESAGGPTTKPDGGPTTTIPDSVRIEVVSSQPDRVTGPEARIRVQPAAGESPDDLRVTLGGNDVTEQLPVVGRSREGVVFGLVEGTNTITATGGGHTVSQRVRSWPLTGPMISGPHLPLLACSTEEYGLGAPADADCSAPTRVDWRYVTTAGTVKPLTDPNARPADLATAEIGGTSVPLTIRHEIGVVNRSIYEITWVDPSPGGADTDQSDAAWNRRLVYRYGGGCGTTFGQGKIEVDVFDVDLLTKGYAIASGSFNTFAAQCNDVLSAETTMMVKERLIEELGEPDHTIGEGASGGAMQLHLIVQNYPGLLDGVVALQPFPDVLTAANGVVDCGLLERYYATPGGSRLTDAQRTAVNGHATSKTCPAWVSSYLGLLDPTDGCDPKIAESQIYNATTNPGGVRCTLQDANANQLGRDPATGFAPSPLDNVGVQYGLTGLNRKAITFAQFIALNRAVGGYDLDGHPTAERMAADPAVVQSAYETGRISTGSGDQRKIPIIDVNLWSDRTGDIHSRFRAFSLRDRLTQQGGEQSAPGFQIWTREPGVAEPGSGSISLHAIEVVDRWLQDLASDREGGSREDALERNRPRAAVDNCLPPEATAPISGVGIYDEKGPCRDRYPVSGDPRIAAGAPQADDVLKCQLKPVDPADYEFRLTSDQIAQLEETFPEGVCDWLSAGVGQTTPSMSDRSYEDVVTPDQLA